MTPGCIQRIDFLQYDTLVVSGVCLKYFEISIHDGRRIQPQISYLCIFFVILQKKSQWICLDHTSILKAPPPPTSRSSPLKSFLTKIAPTLSGIPSISVTHFVTYLQVHSFAYVVLSCCLHSLLSNCFSITESLHIPRVKRFVEMRVPLESIQTISPVSILI